MVKLSDMLSELKTAGIDLDKLPKQILEKVQNVAKSIEDPENPKPEDIQKLMKLLSPDLKNPSTDIPKMKQGRNDKCACGSGKKYKKCCLKKMT